MIVLNVAIVQPGSLIIAIIPHYANQLPGLTLKNLSHILHQLEQLEALLRKFKYWQATNLDISQVSTPFGIGQITFEQWLQFVYLPKMHHLIQHHTQCPKSAILPYAQEVLNGQNGADAILTCIARLDELSGED